MPRVLVTGADGFTGAYLVRELAARGHEVHGVVRFGNDLPALEGVQYHACDLDDVAGLNALAGRTRPSKVVHLAAISFVAHADADEIYKTNLLGTRHLLEALVQSDEALDAVLIASSANIYGNNRSGRLDEKCQPDPVNDYAVSKLAMEYLARTYEGRLPLIVVRPFNYTGVGQSKNFVIPKIIDHVRRGAAAIELGNVDVDRDWSDVRSVVDIYARLLAEPKAAGKTINVCSGVARGLREIIDEACRQAGHQIEIRVNPEFVRANEVRSLCGSTSRLEQVLGPLKMIPIEETIGWMLRA
jgi:nucleoside-diphosphate-sugar epimerase